MASKKSRKKIKAKSKKALKKKLAPKRKTAPKRRRARGKSQSESLLSFRRAGLGANSGGQSGDLQGLSGRANADSESVNELLEEGNSFEAEVVEGVQDVPDADQGEVRTREVPEDDVPEEYLGKDR